MQKIWNKAFPNVHHGNWIMTPGVKAFLSDLHHCSSFKDLKDFAECGGVELRKLNDTNYNDQSNAKAALGMDPITERLVDAYDHSMFDQDELSDSDKEDEPSFSNRGISLNPAAAMYPMYSQAAIVTSVPSFQPPSGTSLPASNRMATAVPNKRVSFAEQVNPMDMSAYGSVASHPSTMLNPQNVMNYTVNPYHNPALMAMNPILTADALTGPLLLNRFPDDGNTDQHKSSKKRAYAGIKNRGNVYSEANQVTTELPVSKKASRAELRPSQDSMIDLTASNSLAPSVSQSSKVHKPQNLPNGKSAAVNLETEKESAHSHEDTNRSEIVGPEMDFSLGGFSNIMGMSLMKAPTNASRIDDTMDHSSKEKDDSRSNGTMSSVSRLSAEGIFAQVTAGGIKRA